MKNHQSYVSGYSSAKPVLEQVDVLCSLFPSLNPDKLIAFAKNYGPAKTPVPTEGLFVLIRRGVLGNDREELELLFEKLKHAYRGSFFNQEAARMSRENFHPKPGLSWFEQEMLRTQGESDLVLVAAQLGAHYQGFSGKEARSQFGSKESGIYPKDFATILLTHPERLKHRDDLHVLCAGNSLGGCDPIVHGVFSFGSGTLQGSCIDPLDHSPFHSLEFSVQKEFIVSGRTGVATAFYL